VPFSKLSFHFCDKHSPLIPFLLFFLVGSSFHPSFLAVEFIAQPYGRGVAMSIEKAARSAKLLVARAK